MEAPTIYKPICRSVPQPPPSSGLRRPPPPPLKARFAPRHPPTRSAAPPSCRYSGRRALPSACATFACDGRGHEHAPVAVLERLQTSGGAEGKHDVPRVCASSEPVPEAVGGRVVVRVPQPTSCGRRVHTACAAAPDMSKFDLPWGVCRLCLPISRNILLGPAPFGMPRSITPSQATRPTDRQTY